MKNNKKMSWQNMNKKKIFQKLIEIWLFGHDVVDNSMKLVEVLVFIDEKMKVQWRQILEKWFYLRNGNKKAVLKYRNDK